MSDSTELNRRREDAAKDAELAEKLPDENVREGGEIADDELEKIAGGRLPIGGQWEKSETPQRPRVFFHE